MPYLTVMQTPRKHQITLNEILDNAVPLSAFCNTSAPISATVTHFYQNLSYAVSSKADVSALIHSLSDFCETYTPLYDVSRASLYRTFYIPKRSGGLRKINAPNDDLMQALRALKRLFEADFSALYHTSAFAYIRNRRTVDAVARHQQNKSRWFLKTDFSDFFGSTTKPFLMSMLSQIFPFSEVVRSDEGRILLDRAVDLCFLDGGLPQGTPISPMLTNLMMIPIDFTLCNMLRSNGFVYTRYADDILISHQYDFSFRDQCVLIDSVLAQFGAPFKIKPSKTRYGSASGSNWNLGVMLNKDNQITIGHQKKKQFESMCHNYICDRLASISWELHDLQVFSGLIAYYKMIEGDVINRIIAHYNQKYHVNMMTMLRQDLRTGACGNRPD